MIHDIACELLHFLQVWLHFSFVLDALQRNFVEFRSEFSRPVSALTFALLVTLSTSCCLLWAYFMLYLHLSGFSINIASAAISKSSHVLAKTILKSNTKFHGMKTRRMAVVLLLKSSVVPLPSTQQVADNPSVAERGSKRVGLTSEMKNLQK
jgi:hypothetical protein